MEKCKNMKRGKVRESKSNFLSKTEMTQLQWDNPKRNMTQLQKNGII